MAGCDSSAPRGQGPVLVAVADIKGWVDEAAVRESGALLCSWQHPSLLGTPCRQDDGRDWLHMEKGWYIWAGMGWNVTACLFQHQPLGDQSAGKTEARCDVFAKVEEDQVA